MKRRFIDLRATNLARSKAAGVGAGDKSEVPTKPPRLNQRQVKTLLKRKSRKPGSTDRKTTTPWQRLSMYEGGSQVSGGLPSLGKRGR